MKTTLLFAVSTLAYAAQAQTLNIDISHIDTQSQAWQAFASATASNAYDAVIRARVTGNAADCTLAIAKAEEQVTAYESAINQVPVVRPAIAGDSYLQSGPMLADIAAPYAYCDLTNEQQTRWSAYAEQTLNNIWNYATASWNGAPFAWSGWGTNNPANNYFYSFIHATSLWGFAANPEWIDFLRDNKLPQINAYFTANGTGGGSREGTW